MLRLPLQCVLWGCLLSTVFPASPTPCRKNQYQVNNHCCDLCPPGERLTTDCTEDIQTKCSPCEQDEFSDSWNREPRCHQHKYCDNNLGLQERSKGTSETDTICACQDGKHCSSHACELCVPHTSCSVGFGVKQKATEVSDTICEPCPDGFFSNISSASESCRPWTSCEAQNLVVLQAGTDKTDVRCGSHDRKRGLLLIPVVLVALMTVLLVSVYIRKVVRRSGSKGEINTKRQDPVETEDLPGHNTAAPVQETLHGCQPVTQEDGKESRIAVQEHQ
ncbi:tumor necrosis factor receptor superfamily member 5 isoform X1 [Ochotona curzoniae]|uniref:tumor necrosis factor receptor superfamily member 5 isoform X1 n=1 Tax=Ochotona curzoniae TaxID=130825 RepID=UPI001B3485BF|nr:tumor necrosis factor receptor superfamily member 5 isoform X1 [Ochotona curzoniae]